MPLKENKAKRADWLFVCGVTEDGRRADYTVTMMTDLLFRTLAEQANFVSVCASG